MDPADIQGLSAIHAEAHTDPVRLCAFRCGLKGSKLQALPIAEVATVLALIAVTVPLAMEVDAMADPYTLNQYVNDLRAITAKEADPVRITELAAPLAKKFAQSPGWFRDEYRECDAEQGFGVHMLHEEPNHDLAVFLVSWLPDRGTTPHNHKTWAVVVGMEGEEKEISYDRLDDGASPGFAELRRGGEQVITEGEVTRCYPEHIHSVWNVGKNVSMSLHTYGRHINYTGRSEFDLEHKREKPYVLKIAVDEQAHA